MIHNIPANLYTIETMDALGSAIGKVEEMAYDPKISQTKDYVRAGILFNIANPARNAKVLNLPTGESVAINYEYEKLKKRCFHCLRLTHEKSMCPLLKKNTSRTKEVYHPQDRNGDNTSKKLTTVGGSSSRLLEGPPGFPSLFTQLSKHDQQMALHICHTQMKESDVPESKE